MKENKVIREKTDSPIHGTGKAKTINGFFSGKGFYVALAVSLVAIGGAAWIGINSVMNKLESDNEIAIEQEQLPPNNVEDEWSLPTQKEVAKSQSGIDATKQENLETEKAAQPSPDADTSNNATPQGFINSVSGKTINDYSGENVVKSKTLDEWIMHTGIDIEAAISTPVKAVSGGTVGDITNDDMWGTCIVISHGGGLESHYYNLKSSVNVKKNQQVKLGDVIGAVGDTAQIEQSEESHLHFAMKKNGEWVNPHDYIKL